MVETGEIYKCNVCGNIVEVIFAGGGDLVCCGENMEHLKEKTSDAGLEKHVPVIEKTKTGVKVTVGSNAHPMEDKHYIMFIEVIADGKVYRKNLLPKDHPVAEFELIAKKITAREFCNIHGLWKKDL
ncbi:MAG: desulfoferrodoxin [archaeon]